MSHLAIKFPLPKPKAPVDRRELTVAINGLSKTHILPGSATMSDEFVLADNDAFSVTLVDVDAHGNKSVPSEPLKGRAGEIMRPEKPELLGPIEASHKRVLTDDEAVKAKQASSKKASDASKVESDKVEKLAKEEADKTEKARREAEKAKADAEKAEKDKKPIR